MEITTEFYINVFVKHETNKQDRSFELTFDSYEELRQWADAMANPE